MHMVHRQGAGAGGRVSPHAHSPWPPPAYRRRTIPIHRGGAGTHGGLLLYGEADSIPHEEEGGGWDMLDRDVECRRKRGYAGEGCGMRKEEDGLECDLCL